jgi:hypothetical protein
MIIYQTSPITIEGGQQEAIVSDWDTQSLLSKILKELVKANIHNTIITDMNIENTEVDA